MSGPASPRILLFSCGAENRRWHHRMKTLWVKKPGYKTEGHVGPWLGGDQEQRFGITGSHCSRCPGAVPSSCVAACQLPTCSVLASSFLQPTTVVRGCCGCQDGRGAGVCPAVQVANTAIPVKLCEQHLSKHTALSGPAPGPACFARQWDPL